MLKPSYLMEAAQKRAGESSNAEPTKRKTENEQHINPKLKQFYEIRTQIKPFYSGGKISVIDDQKFVCQCGPAIKVINRTPSIIKKEDDEQTQNNTLGLDDTEDEKNDFKSSFSIDQEFEVELDDTISFDACPTSRLLITTHKSNLLRLWCLMSGKLIKTVKSLHHLPIGFVEIHKLKAYQDYLQENNVELEEKGVNENISHLAAIENARSQLNWLTVSGAGVKFWQTGGNQMSKLIRIDNITSVGYVRWGEDYNKDQVYVAERNIYVMGIKPGTKEVGVLTTLEGHYSQVTGIEFGKDIMISGGRDKVIILWDLKKDYNKLKTFPFPNSIEAIFLVEPSNLFVAISPSEVRHFDIEKQSLSKASVLSLNENETIAGFHSIVRKIGMAEPKFQTWFISTHLGTIYDVMKTKKDVDDSTVCLSIARQYVGSLDEILCALFWIDNKIAVCNNTSVIKVYDLKSGSCDFLRGHTDIVLSLACQKDWLVSVGKDNQIIFWQSSSMEPQVKLGGHLASVTSVCFSPAVFIAYSVSEDNFLKSWDKTKCLKSVLAHDKEINSVHCSPNGALIVTGSRDKAAKIWDAESLSLVANLKGHKKGVWDAKFSSWDQLVVTSSADTTIKIWSLTTFQCVQTLQGHLSSVLQSQFINSGLQVISVSSDGSMKIWELKTSACLATEECGNDKIWTIDSSPDGSVVVTGSADSVLTIWHDITETKIMQSIEKKKKLIEDEQKLENILNSGKWKDAFQLAIALDRPFILLKVLREVSNFEEFKPIIKELDEEQMAQLLQYITKWNTNSKTSTEAQMLLHVINLTMHHKELARQIQPMSLLPYTEKHLDRLYAAKKQMVMLDFIANGDF